MNTIEIQSLLKKLGYFQGPTNGVENQALQAAISKLQEDYGLTVTGTLTEETLDKFEKLLEGFVNYTIKENDDIFSIAQKYGINTAFILAANPDIDPRNLQVGSKIVVPLPYDIVDTNVRYTYDILEKDIASLKVRYPMLQVGSIGKSSLGRDLYYLKLGDGSNEVFFNSSHHGLEWITTPLVMKWAENFLVSYVTGTNMKGYDVRKIWDDSTIYIVPMVNPDGVDLVLNGLSEDNPNYNELLEWNKNSTDFSTNWQANNNGVDLNHNYPAGWENSKVRAEELGFNQPGPTRYPGPVPLSEPETAAIVEFVRSHDFRLVIAYHSQGEVIYWTFEGLQPVESKVIGEDFARVSGYKLDEPVAFASYAGMKDWFIQEYRKPGYTIEVGRGKNPLPISQFDKIYRDNEEVMLLASIV